MKSNANINVQEAIPFIMVTNMERSLTFYVEGLKFELVDQWEPEGKIKWCQIRLGGASVMLQEFETHKPDNKLGEGVSVYFICKDAIAIYLDLTKSGLNPAEPFVGNRMWVVGILDPDGYELYFESPTDVPEETSYSEWSLKS